jgi:hypothetical protein
MKKHLLILFLLFPYLSLWAVDFGLILNQSAGYGGIGKDGLFDYSLAAVPRGI